DDKAHKNADKKQRQDQRDASHIERQHNNRAEARQDNRTGRRIYQRGEFKERFQDRDRERVVTYFSKYKGSNRGLPPALARHWDSGRRLPGGWRDHLVVGYVIEPDWSPALYPVPYTWFPDLAVVPDTRLYWYGDRVVRVYEPTREVVDVIVVPTIHIDL
ncbi:MAG: hypothetical protein V4689_05040, partial [Verrucomicrobiota bacterium]